MTSTRTIRTRSRAARAVLACTALLAGTAITPAQATFPGVNGRIFFEQGKNVYSANPNGTGKKVVARAGWWTGSPNLREPAPSPDAKRLALSPGGRDI